VRLLVIVRMPLHPEQVFLTFLGPVSVNQNPDAREDEDQHEDENHTAPTNGLEVIRFLKINSVLYAEASEDFRQECDGESTGRFGICFQAVPAVVIPVLRQNLMPPRSWQRSPGIVGKVARMVLLERATRRQI
jgi:hypothetical protein